MVNISWFCFVSPLAVSRRRGGGDFLPIILWEQILLNQWRQYYHHQGDKLGAEKEALSENRVIGSLIIGAILIHPTFLEFVGPMCKFGIMVNEITPSVFP